MKRFKYLLRGSLVGSECVIDSDVIIYPFCNIYGDNTRILAGCKIGAYTEISNAFIEDHVSIGAKCFIPGKVRIEANAFIGPGVSFTHEFPPMDSDKWKPTTVRQGAKIGQGAIIKGGVTIGKDAVIGCGAVVTKNVPSGETWVGNPAKKIKKGEK